ncbi:MAG: XrtA-associated tyrosine autokinase [Motiliproteus sp.]|nr:XrtA-associated tyrosine autokinase [Motiliproteus sp.]MCW9053312.1 XrtA-associated tyrosine autokinase [Motiliproteus sp.]
MKNTIERALEKKQRIEAEKQGSSILAEPLRHADPVKKPERPAVEDLSNLEVTQRSEPATPQNKEAIEVNIERLVGFGMITPDEDFTQIKEEYRYIKRPILNNAFGDNNGKLINSNLVMVSSSFPGEGKTFTAINLAISFALEQDRKVLLVDADVINPHICKRLDISEQKGLLDYLRGSCEVSDIINDTNISNLKLLTAGTRSHHTTELLASDKMLTLMSELSTRYNDRIVVFDTAPILGASETGVLSQMIGQAVVVVEEERTTHGQLERALSQLDPKTAVGLVLNKSKKSRREYYGYYYANSK